jgi:hypothetical protein
MASRTHEHPPTVPKGRHTHTETNTVPQGRYTHTVPQGRYTHTHTKHNTRELRNDPLPDSKIPDSKLPLSPSTFLHRSNEMLTGILQMATISIFDDKAARVRVPSLRDCVRVPALRDCVWVRDN